MVEPVKPARRRRAYRAGRAECVQLELDLWAVRFGPVGLMPDETLCRYASQGDNEAMDEILKRYEPMIKRVSSAAEGAVYRLNSGASWQNARDERDEARASVTAKIVRQISLGKYTPQKGYTFGSWLKKVAENSLHDLRRTSARRPRPDQFGEAEPSYDVDIDTRISLEQAMASLGEFERSLFLASIEGRPSLKRMREQLGIPAADATVMVEAARKKLQAFLQS